MALSNKELEAKVADLESQLHRTQITLAVVIQQRDTAMNELADARVTVALLQK